jgi:hypothetical protein
MPKGSSHVDQGTARSRLDTVCNLARNDHAFLCIVDSRLCDRDCSLVRASFPQQHSHWRWRFNGYAGLHVDLRNGIRE